MRNRIYAALVLCLALAIPASADRSWNVGSGGGGGGTLQGDYDVSSPPDIAVSTSGLTIKDLSSSSKAFHLCFDINKTDCLHIYKSGGSPQWVYDTAYDAYTLLPSGKTWGIKNSTGTTPRFTVSEAGAVDITGVTSTSGWVQSIPVRAISADGSVCTLTNAALVSGRGVKPLITCTSTTNGNFDFTLPVPGSWNNGSITIDLYAAHIGGSAGSGNLVIQCAGVVVSSGNVEPAKSNTGAGSATLDFSGVAQYSWVHSTTAAITLQTVGSQEVRRLLSGHCDTVSATTTLSNIKIDGDILVNFTKGTWTD